VTPQLRVTSIQLSWRERKVRFIVPSARAGLGCRRNILPEPDFTSQVRMRDKGRWFAPKSLQLACEYWLFFLAACWMLNRGRLAEEPSA